MIWSFFVAYISLYFIYLYVKLRHLYIIAVKHINKPTND